MGGGGTLTVGHLGWLKQDPRLARLCRGRRGGQGNDDPAVQGRAGQQLNLALHGAHLLVKSDSVVGWEVVQRLRSDLRDDV